MIRNIAAAVIVGSLCAAVWAEDQDKSATSSQQQQDQSATGAQKSDRAGQSDQSARDRSSAAGASATDDQAQPASARGQAEQAETDPTKAFIKETAVCNQFEIKA